MQVFDQGSKPVERLVVIFTLPEFNENNAYRPTLGTLKFISPNKADDPKATFIINSIKEETLKINIRFPTEEKASSNNLFS